MDDFLWRALAAGLGVALAGGPVGAFVVWRRMSFFGGALAHAALLGVVLGLALGVAPGLGVAVVAVLAAVALVVLQGRFRVSDDSLLFVIAHGALAVGLVCVAFLEGVSVDLLAYLFGDILAVTEAELLWLWLAVLVVGGLLAVFWRPLLKISVHEELALADGVPVAAVNLAFMVMIALIVAAAMKVVGILLVASLLVIPATAASRFSRTPEQMAGLAAILGCLSVGGGLFASLRLDTPAGPSIVVAALILFALGAAVPASRVPGN